MVVISTNGHEILIDIEDYAFLKQFSWHTRSDRTNFKLIADRGPKHKVRLMHRLILDDPKDLTVDHINGNTLDNRKVNLRICSIKENTRNRQKRKDKTSSKYKGVSLIKSNKKWYASIKQDGKSYNLGTYQTEIQAAKAYDKKAIELFGEYANINFRKDG